MKKLNKRNLIQTFFCQTQKSLYPFLILFFLLGISSVSYAQILQQDATLTAGTDFFDGDTYTDSGGVAGDYDINELSTLNLCAEAGGTISIDFTSFEVEASGGAGGQCWDNLTIVGDAGGGDATYAGDTFDAGADLVCTDATDADGNPTLGPFTSSEGGCLALTFDSDGSVTQSGWSADITVVDPPQEIIQQEGTLTAGTDFFDGDTYTDSGGAAGDYDINELSTLNLCAEPGETVTITFTDFEVEASGGGGGQCWDNLTVVGDAGGGDATYAGDTFDAGADLVCTDGTDADGNPTLGPFTSEPGGCLSMTFDSDGSVAQSGWQAVISINEILCNPPVAVCSDFTVNLDANGVASISPADIDGGSTADCGGLSLGFEAGDQVDYACSDVGTPITVTLVVVDVNGDEATCDATVTVEDNIPPTISCASIVRPAAANCMYLGGAGPITVGDNCAPVNILGQRTNPDGAISFFTTAPQSGTFEFGGNFDLGVTTFVMTATDNSGNSAECTYTVTVEDVTPPDALCQNVTVTLDNEGNGSVSVADINNGSFDNCTAVGDLVITLTGLTNYTCNQVGTNGVTLSVTDEAGVTGTCAATVTVQDTSPAEIECRQPVSTVNTPGECGKINLVVLEPFALYDNCGADNVTFTRIPAGNDFPIGTTTLNWTGTDANGNTSTCQSLVIVEDNELPTVASCNSAIDFIDPGSCTGQVTVTTDIFDNCGIVSIEGTGTFTLPFGLHPNPITVTDVNGNVTVHDFTIFMHDDLAPEFTNCPEATVNLVAGADGTANYPAQTPVAVDNCEVPTITNDLPENGFPLGSSVVTFTAEDAYGNTTDCVVNVEVSGGISLHPVSDIESSLAENETAQTIAWNALNAGTVCELCEETSLEGFRYVGTWWGHQYFLADESSLTREEASLIAEGYDAHLAVINDEAENAYLTEALDEEIRSAWIGLMPILVDEEWTFAWDNGDAVDFDAIAFEEITAETRIILGSDGAWKAATIEEDKHFLIERPCVDFSQTGPIYTPEVEDDEEEIPGVLLRSGDVWPQGEYEVTYTLADMCGNEAVMSFDVDVLTEVAEYCATAGVDNSIWVEKFVFHDLTNETENNAGYADFTEETTTMNIGDGVILVQLEAGGNEAEEMLYWNIYMDANADGDFYDAGEMLYQVASREDVETNLSLPVTSVENARLRVMVSRYAFAAPCGDTYVGEIEDYNLNLLIPEDYARAACEVDVAGLNGERNGFSVDLDWTVNSVCPIENYTIEYNVNGVNFESVTQIQETDISDVIYTKDYTTTLPAIVGTVIYRIKVQTTGQPAFYTNPVSFRLNGKPNAPILHPNPADTYVSVALGEYVGQSGTLVIYDNLGKVRLTQVFDTSTGDQMILNLQKFTDGIYHVSIEAEGKRMQTQRLVIDKLYGWNVGK
jgi:hypothetical protein